MIRNQWYVILESKEVKKKKIISIKRMGEKLILWRDEELKVHCLVDRCCHRGAVLSKGKLINSGKEIQCPFHGLEYGGDGKCKCIPANSRSSIVSDRYKVPSYPVYEDYGFIWIWWGKGNKEKSFDNISTLILNASIERQMQKTPFFFSDIDTSFVSYTVKDYWKAHYSRVIENQLDVVHLPFVHHNTIGRGNKTVVDGPAISWVNNQMFYTYVYNRKDDGTKPKQSTDLDIPPLDKDFKLEFIFPNLWQNYISKKLRIVIAFVPINDEKTVLYIRTYQKFIKIPLLKNIIGFLFSKMNKIIAHQDRRIVQTQGPKESSLNNDEQLIQGDLPIIEYRKKRKQLKN